MPGPQSPNTLVQTAAQQYDLLTADLFDSVDEQVIASRAGQHLIAYFCTKIKEQFERGLWTVTPPPAQTEPTRCSFMVPGGCIRPAGHSGFHFGGQS